MKGHRLSFLVQVVVVIFLTYGCHDANSKTKSSLEEAGKAIEQSNKVYFQAFVKGDSSIFIDRYAEDCCIMLPNSPTLCGADAPLKFFRIAYYQIGLRNGRFTTTGIYGTGDDYVTEEGLWQLLDSNNVMFDNGKFLVLWKKTPKGWKMFRDSFSSNLDKDNQAMNPHPFLSFPGYMSILME